MRFYTAAGYAYKLEPSADAALGIAKQAVKAKDYDKAIQYLKKQPIWKQMQFQRLKTII